jgi:hypothetical protein
MRTLAAGAVVAALLLLLTAPHARAMTPLARRLGLVRSDSEVEPAIPAGCEQLWFDQALDHFK